MASLKNKLIVIRFLIILVVLTLLLPTIYSCNDNKYEVEKFYKNGKLKSRLIYKGKNNTENYYAEYYRENGSLICKGSRVNDEKNGKWEYRNEQNIITSIEKFCNGLLCDTQVVYHSDGKLDRYKILDNPIPCFCDTQLHYGFTQVAYYRNGNLKEINHIKNCDFNGLVKLYDSTTGRLYEEYFEINNLKNGSYIYYNPDSSKIVGTYKNNKEYGKWKHIKGDSLIDQWDFK